MQDSQCSASGGFFSVSCEEGDDLATPDTPLCSWYRLGLGGLDHHWWDSRLAGGPAGARSRIWHPWRYCGRYRRGHHWWHYSKRVLWRRDRRHFLVVLDGLCWRRNSDLRGTPDYWWPHARQNYLIERACSASHHTGAARAISCARCRSRPRKAG